MAASRYSESSKDAINQGWRTHVDESQLPPAFLAQTASLSLTGMQELADGQKEAPLSKAEGKAPARNLDWAEEMYEDVAPLPKTEGGKPEKAPRGLQTSRFADPPSAVAAGKEAEVKLATLDKRAQVCRPEFGAGRLVPPSLPNQAVRQHVWERVYQAEDVGVGLVCGPFELQVPAGIDFAQYVWGDRGASLLKINEGLIDSRVRVAWAYDTSREAVNGEQLKKLVVGLRTYDVDDPPMPGDKNLREALCKVWKQVEAWGLRLLQSRPVPLVDILSVEASLQWAQNRSRLDCRATPNEQLAREFAEARREARVSVARILVASESVEGAEHDLTDWVMEAYDEDQHSSFRAPDRVEMAELAWTELASPDQLWFIHSWAKRMREYYEEYVRGNAD